MNVINVQPLANHSELHIMQGKEDSYQEPKSPTHQCPACLDGQLFQGADAGNC